MCLSNRAAWLKLETSPWETKAHNVDQLSSRKWSDKRKLTLAMMLRLFVLAP